MQNEQEQYVVPELKLVGETDDVVLGGLGSGGDIWGMYQYSEMEFEADR
jgi:hypothetical protein